MLPRVGLALGAGTLFFLVSNFAVWMSGGGYGHPHTLAGLMSTYADGIPFYRNELIANALGTVALFGLDGLLAPVLAGRGGEAVETH